MSAFGGGGHGGGGGAPLDAAAGPARPAAAAAAAAAPRAILHLDADAMYCQVESLRLGIPLEAVPLAVQQW